MEQFICWPFSQVKTVFYVEKWLVGLATQTTQVLFLKTTVVLWFAEALDVLSIFSQNIKKTSLNSQDLIKLTFLPAL